VLNIVVVHFGAYINQKNKIKIKKIKKKKAKRKCKK